MRVLSKNQLLKRIGDHVAAIMNYYDRIGNASKLMHHTVSSDKMRMSSALNSLNSNITISNIDEMIMIAGELIDKLLHSKESVSIIDQETYRARPIIEVIRTLQLMLGQLKEFASNDLSSLPALPSERPAPIKVAVAGGRIILTNHKQQIGSISPASAERIKDGIRRNLEAVVSELPASTNADRRYVSACQRLLDNLAQPMVDVSIEALGLDYQLVQKLTEKFSDEIGEMMLEEIQHVLTSLNVFLNQFDEWRKFLEELALTQIDPADSSGLVLQANNLLQAFEEEGAPVDKSVSQRLRAIVEPVINCAIEAESISVPLICSLSNIFSLLAQIAVENAPAITATTGTTAVIGFSGMLVPFAVDVIERFCPILSQYQPFKFLLNVVRYISKNYSQTKDATGISH